MSKVDDFTARLVYLLRATPPPTSLDYCTIAYPLTKTAENVLIVAKEDENNEAEGGILGVDMMSLGMLAHKFKANWQKCRKVAGSSSIDNSFSNINELATLYQSTTCLLLLCPDSYGAWNDRKRIIEMQLAKGSGAEGELDPSTERSHAWNIALKNEFSFVNLVLTKHGKSPHLWAHRKWLSKLFMSLIDWTDKDEHRVMMMSHEDDVRIVLNWAAGEQAVTEQIIKKYPKNYYAYEVRRNVVDQLARVVKDGLVVEGLDCLLSRAIAAEIDWCEKFIGKTPTDHSCCNLHHHAIKAFLSLRSTTGEEHTSKVIYATKKASVIDAMYTKMGMPCETIGRWRRMIDSMLIKLPKEETTYTHIRDYLGDPDFAKMTKTQKRHHWAKVAWVCNYSGLNDIALTALEHLVNPEDCEVINDAYSKLHMAMAYL